MDNNTGIELQIRFGYQCGNWATKNKIQTTTANQSFVYQYGYSTAAYDTDCRGVYLLVKRINTLDEIVLSFTCFPSVGTQITNKPSHDTSKAQFKAISVKLTWKLHDGLTKAIAIKQRPSGIKNFYKHGIELYEIPCKTQCKAAVAQNDLPDPWKMIRTILGI